MSSIILLWQYGSVTCALAVVVVVGSPLAVFGREVNEPGGEAVRVMIGSEHCDTTNLRKLKKRSDKKHGPVVTFGLIQLNGVLREDG